MTKVCMCTNLTKISNLAKVHVYFVLDVHGRKQKRSSFQSLCHLNAATRNTEALHGLHGQIFHKEDLSRKR